MATREHGRYEGSRGWSQGFGPHGHKVRITELRGVGEELYVVIPARRGRSTQKFSLAVGGLRDASGKVKQREVVIDARREADVCVAGHALADALARGDSVATAIATFRERVGVRRLPGTARPAPPPPAAAEGAVSAAARDLTRLLTGSNRAPTSDVDVTNALLKVLTLAGIGGRAATTPTTGLSLAAGVRAFYEPHTGAVAATTRNHREVRHMVELLLPQLQVQVDTWEALRPRHVLAALRAFVQETARDNARRPTPRLYFRSMERAVQTLERIARWLAEEERAATHFRLERDWKEKLRTYYQEVYPGVAVKPPQARVKMDSYRAMLAWFADLSHVVEERLRGLVLTAVERRPTQVLRATRRDLLLDAATGRPVQCQIHGRGRKRGMMIKFDDFIADYWAHALAVGHLAELERAFQAHGTNYPLFPGGTPREGRFERILASQTPVSVGHLRDLLKKLVQAHPEWGVSAAEMTGFYAVKRAASDSVDQLPMSPKAKMAVTGHYDAATLQRHYVSREFTDADFDAGVEARKRARGY